MRFLGFVRTVAVPLFDRALSRRFSEEREREDTERMTAFRMLGIAPTDSREEIIEAHRRLMRLVHPDVGGSEAMASQINEARDFLLKH